MFGGLQVLRHIEQSDLGCGGGGGRDSADVFRLAGLTFITNANANPSSSSTSINQSINQSVTIDWVLESTVVGLMCVCVCLCVCVCVCVCVCS